MRRVGWVLGFVALCVGATGCWGQQGQGPDRAAYNAFETTLTPDTVDGLHRLWSASPGDIVGQPVVSRAGVHVAAFDTFDSTAGLDLVTYSAGGQELWTRPVTPDLLYKPQDASGPLVVGDRVGAGYTFYSASGNSSEAPSFDVATGAPAGSLGDGPIVAARDDKTVSTFFRLGPPQDEAGTQVHDLATGQTTLVSRSDNGRFTLGRERLYRTHFGFVTALASTPAGEPQELWTANLSNPESSEPVLSPDETTVYVVSSDSQGTRGELVALDAATGARRWTANLGSGGTTPALAGDTVYVQTTLGWLIAFDARGCGGATQCPAWWEVAAGSTLGTTTQPAVAGDVVYTAWADGSIVATDRTGGVLWEGSAGSEPITSGPVVTGGRLYVTDAGGTLTAFGL